MISFNNTINYCAKPAAPCGLLLVWFNINLLVTELFAIAMEGGMPTLNIDGVEKDGTDGFEDGETVLHHIVKEIFAMPLKSNAG